jgi:farnesyl diphosphate synthase
MSSLGPLPRFESFATRALPAADEDPASLHGAMRYAVLGGGKRIRARLVYAAGEAAGAEPVALDPIALAIECVHAYSLVHDDLPCMDDDVLRRGRPTVHVAFDEATAMLAGDALQAEAFRLISEAPVAAPVAVALVRELALAAGPAGMCGGQAADLAAQGRVLGEAQLEAMHQRKTGALLRACVRMGALAGPGGEALLPALDRYADAIGLAFQIVDDILDAEGSSEELGKTAGKDAAQGKATYVTLLGVARARERALQCHRDALEALGSCGLPEARTHALANLAGRILGRRS